MCSKGFGFLGVLVCKQKSVHSCSLLHSNIYVLKGFDGSFPKTLAAADSVWTGTKKVMGKVCNKTRLPTIEIYMQGLLVVDIGLSALFLMANTPLDSLLL